MLLGSDVTPFDTIHLNTPIAAVGSFRLSCEEPQFCAKKALDHHHLVLPRSPLYILQDGVAPFVADPVMVTFHNPGVPYRRAAIAGRDDDCDYVVLREDVLEEIAHVPGRTRYPRYRFGSSQRALPPRSFLAAHLMFDAARRGTYAQLALEEAALQFAAVAVAGSGGQRVAPGCVRALRPPSGAPRLDPVARAKRYLVESPAAARTLGATARAAYVSPYHLTRLFRARTGLSLHQYSIALRLRSALYKLPAYQGHLATLAAELGFSDLAHLSRLFARAFGMSPAVYLGRRRVQRRRCRAHDHL